MRRRARMWAAVATAIAVSLSIAVPATMAAVVPVDIRAGEFDPAVVVIGPGSSVKWTNRDVRPRALRDVESPAIRPGRSFELDFPRPGVYEYRDRENPLLTGTVIVSTGFARGKPHYPSPLGPRIVSHRWRVDFRFDLRESWKYMDGKFLSFDGPCNAQVGRGNRSVTFHATFSDVVYQRVGRLEILSGKSSPYRIQRYRETIDSKSSDPSSGGIVDCGDGSFDPPPDVEQKCDHDFAGARVRAELSWSPRIGQGRFQWPHAFLGSPPREENCGHSLLAGHLVGLDADHLPWDPGAGSELLYDHGRTSPVTTGEARALRDGRRVTIERSFELQWTADCCLEWNEPDKPGTYVRAGARHEARGRVTIRFVPR